MYYDRKKAETRFDPSEFYREATEHLGVDATRELCLYLRRLENGWNDAIARKVMRAMEMLRRQRASSPHLADHIPAQDVFQDELPIAVAPGLRETRTVVRIPAALLVLHSLVCGTPGRGKTFFVRQLLQSLITTCPWARILVFDPNYSYTDICSDPRLWLSVPWEDVRLNPLQEPDGYPEMRYRNEAVDRICRDELKASRWVIAKRLDQCVARKTVPPLASGTPTRVSFAELCEDVINSHAKPGSKEEMYRQSAANVLDGLMRTSGEVYKCAGGMEALLTDTRAHIMTNGLAPVQTLDSFVTSIVQYACRRRETETLQVPPDLNTLIVIEEAQVLLAKRSESVSYYQELLLRARSLGIGFVFVAQDPSRIDPLVHAACSNFFVFGQSSAESKRVAKNILDLSPREAIRLGELGVGEFYMRMASHAKFPFPFLARTSDGK